jgi:hypothetical protein
VSGRAEQSVSGLNKTEVDVPWRRGSRSAREVDEEKYYVTLVKCPCVATVHYFLSPHISHIYKHKI